MNRGFIASLIVTLSLTGCGAVQQAQLNSAMKTAQQDIGKECSMYLHLPPKEAAAWARTLTEAQSCGTGKATPEQMPARAACMTKIINEEIKPITYSPQKFARYMAVREREQNKFAAGELSFSELQAGTKRRLDAYTANAPWSYYHYATCRNDVMERKVLPAYNFKPLMMDYMTNFAAFARQADKEKMAREDFNIGSQRLWTDFAKTEQNAMAEARADNTAAWQNFSQSLQQMQAQQAQTQALQRASMPTMTTTDCRVSGGGNTVNCTSF